MIIKGKQTQLCTVEPLNNRLSFYKSVDKCESPCILQLAMATVEEIEFILRIMMFMFKM